MDWKGWMMERLRKAMFMMLVSVLFVGVSYATGGGTAPPGDRVLVNTEDVLNASQTQNQTQIHNQTVQGPGYAFAGGSDSYAEGGEGGDADADAVSGSIANISTTSISKPKVRIPPLSVIPPYLPYWTHGGWGTLKAYFPNGPSSHDEVYERTFNPSDPDDMRELRGVFNSLPYSGLLEALGGVFNSIRVVFGGPDNFHHGKGFEIANAFIRARRPEGKPLLVFIDSNIDRKLLNKAGYAYVGKVSLEGDVERNWDQVYDAAVAEALPWDVDILLISGGMKGVTVGSNISFPGAGYGYSQTNYSLSLFGSVSSGITEGKGKALVSAEGYRYWPQALIKRRIPKALYDRIHAKPRPKGQETAQEIPPTTTKQQKAGVKVSRELFELAGFEQGQVQNLIIK
ncbi:MAG: hypothetical protein ACE5NM_04835 [Sedimentisphaerales bacterium]